jgi:SAM-dependent methyltransferase
MVRLINPSNQSRLEKNNGVYKDEEGNCFFIVRGALRLVKDENYAGSFGFQWNKFVKTQIDRELKNSSFSRSRFFAETSWDKEDLTNKDILEVGSGAGRFTHIVLQETKANLYSIDYSDAVTANYENNRHYGERLKLFQASIYEMPFPDNSFDKVFCFGVLQHTPDFKRSVKCLIDKVKPGGELVVDFYPIRGWWTKVHAKYLLRPATKKMKHEKLLSIIEKNVGWLMKLYFFFDKIKIGKITNRFLPICDINRTLPHDLSKGELKEWVILDTFDMFSPEHDHPQRIATVRRWFEEYGMEISFAGFVKYEKDKMVTVVKGIKKGEVKS